MMECRDLWGMCGVELINLKDRTKMNGELKNVNNVMLGKF